MNYLNKINIAHFSVHLFWDFLRSSNNDDVDVTQSQAVTLRKLSIHTLHLSYKIIKFEFTNYVMYNYSFIYSIY